MVCLSGRRGVRKPRSGSHPRENRVKTHRNCRQLGESRARHGGMNTRQDILGYVALLSFLGGCPTTEAPGTDGREREDVARVQPPRADSRVEDGGTTAVRADARFDAGTSGSADTQVVPSQPPQPTGVVDAAPAPDSPVAIPPPVHPVPVVANVRPPDPPPAACQPQCNGNTCGPDGCGGSCGGCPANSACTADGAACACSPGYLPDPSQTSCLLAGGPCNGVSTTGYCADADTWVWCDPQRGLTRASCSAAGVGRCRHLSATAGACECGPVDRNGLCTGVDGGPQNEMHLYCVEALGVLAIDNCRAATASGSCGTYVTGVGHQTTCMCGPCSAYDWKRRQCYPLCSGNTCRVAGQTHACVGF